MRRGPQREGRPDRRGPAAPHRRVPATRGSPRRARRPARRDCHRRLTDLPPGPVSGTDSPRRTGFSCSPSGRTCSSTRSTATSTRGSLDSTRATTDALVLGLRGPGSPRRSDPRSPSASTPDGRAPGAGAGGDRGPGPRRDARAGRDRRGDRRSRRPRQAVEAERAFLQGHRAAAVGRPIGALATIVDGALDLLVGSGRSGRGDGGRPRRTRGRSTTASRSAEADGRAELHRAAPAAGPRDPGGRPGRRPPVGAPRRRPRSGPGPGDRGRARTGRRRARRRGPRHSAGTPGSCVTSANGARALLPCCASGCSRRSRRPALPWWVGDAGRAGASGGGRGVRLPARLTGPTLAAELPLATGDRVLVVRGEWSRRTSRPRCAAAARPSTRSSPTGPSRPPRDRVRCCGRRSTARSPPSSSRAARRSAGW